MKEIPVQKIKGFQIGQTTDEANGTGCTAILCLQGAICGVDVRGGGPATRDTDLLNPRQTVQEVHGVLLGGGSAFGLEAATGVMKYLSEQQVGFPVGEIRVPIVCQADIFDLAVGNSTWPTVEMGYEAAAASDPGNFQPGCYGAGTGASVGKMLGMEYAMKSGIGSAAYQAGDLQVGAVVAVNACSDVYLPDSSTIIAGIYDGKGFQSTEELLCRMAEMQSQAGLNTTIGCVLCNAKLDKAQMNKIAAMAQNGLARTIKPCHMAVDGDTIFAMTTSEAAADLNTVGTMAVKAVMAAVVNAVQSAHPAYGLPASSSIKNRNQ